MEPGHGGPWEAAGFPREAARLLQGDSDLEEAGFPNPEHRPRPPRRPAYRLTLGILTLGLLAITLTLIVALESGRRRASTGGLSEVVQEVEMPQSDIPMGVGGPLIIRSAMSAVETPEGPAGELAPTDPTAPVGSPENPLVVPVSSPVVPGGGADSPPAVPPPDPMAPIGSPGNPVVPAPKPTGPVGSPGNPAVVPAPDPMAPVPKGPTTPTAPTAPTTPTTSTTSSTAPKCVPGSTAQPSLFCFAVGRPGFELDLLKELQVKRASIFGCNDFAVISSIKASLGWGRPGCGEVNTWFNDVPAVSAGQWGVGGMTTNSWLNTNAFIVAWDTLMNSGKLWDHDWIVKVDPDAVFFPDRLRSRVSSHTGQSAYFLNCDHGTPLLYGALEVFSKEAIGTYHANVGKCKGLQWHGWGEDMYMQQCMQAIGATPINDFSLVGDKSCGYAPCTDGSRVAFHAYKDVGSWMGCWQQGR